MYLFYYVSISLPTLCSCLVRKLIQKHLNISIQNSEINPFCGPIIAQIFPKMHGLAYKIFRSSCPNVEHKSAPMRQTDRQTNKQTNKQRLNGG